MTESDLAARAIALKRDHPDWGYIRIGASIGWHKDKVRRAIEHAERKNALMPAQPVGQLAWYETARHALAQAVAIDEVKTIRDKAAALKTYAQQAKDRELIDKATEIKLRAEIRSGEILAEMEKNQGAVAGKTGSKARPVLDARPTLADLGVSRSQSSRWQQLAALPEAEQEAKIAKAKKIAVAMVDDDKGLLKEVRAERQQEKTERRNTIERVLGGIQCALPTRKYGVIYADPPWRFDVWSRETGLEKSPDMHYPTMSVEDICALPIGDLAAQDAVLFLWITVPKLNRMDDVFRAWGRPICTDPEYGLIREPWAYVSNYSWDKELIGPGRWNRNQHEHLLIARIGNPPAPAPSDLVSSVYNEARKRHSAKPEYFADLIERHFPTLPKIELFRRGPPRPNWDSWGNEAVQQQEAAE